MEMVTAGLDVAFEVTYDRDDLFVGMTVYDVTGNVPSIALGPVAMPLLVGNTYYAKFTPDDNKAYTVVKAVYTDNTLSTLDPSYRSGSESFFTTSSSGGSTGITDMITGEVLPNNVITGYLD